MEPADQTNPNKPPGSGSSRLVWLAIAVAVLLFLVQKLGCGPVKTTEKIEWIDRIEGKIIPISHWDYF
ncbi:MAG: hypothetical protein H6577_24095 [Lewinellaceae bacterium]|nr:hypothetical protein [Saprospiraceae bacterium]MCB9341217.1 hypothetical protein [Lewinellaceae bacterium]